MPLLLIFTLLSSVLNIVGAYGPSSNRRCQQVTIPVNVTAHPRVVTLSPPKNQSEVAALVTNFTSMHSNLTTDVVHGPTTLTATYDIWTMLCLPAQPDPSIIEFAIHGITLDHTYWDFGGEGSPYNYADSALEAGHAIFVYDRLGAGKSSKPDGIKEVQQDTEVEVAAELIQYIRRGRTGHRFQKIIGIGHSYGSQLLTGIDAKYGNLLNATILTGFTPYFGGFPTAIASFGLTIASEVNPNKFGSLNSSYVTVTNEQTAFYYFPFYDPNVFCRASETKDAATLGQFVTSNAMVASNYTNPVLVITGARDFIYCGGDCYQPFGNFSDLVLSSYVLFPNVWLFSWAIPANMGHIVNFHYGAPEVYKVIQLWISQLSPKIPDGG